MLLAKLKGAIRRVLLQGLRWSWAYGAFCSAEAWLLERILRVETCRKCQLNVLATHLRFCHQLWDAPQLNWNGDLLGCCFNNKRTFGNALETPLAELLAGRDYRYMQNMLTGRTPRRDDLPCVTCRVLPSQLRAR